MQWHCFNKQSSKSKVIEIPSNTFRALCVKLLYYTMILYKVQTFLHPFFYSVTASKFSLLIKDSFYARG